MLFKRTQQQATLPPYCIIVDTGNYTLVALQLHIPTTVLLTESMMDTAYVTHKRPAELPEILAAGPSKYPEWTWDRTTFSFKRTRPEIVTDRLRQRAVLAAEKGRALFIAHQSINRLREKVNSGLFFQPYIYEQKKLQAQRFKDADYASEALPAAPYIAQYADIAGISARDAADEIMLRAQLVDEVLLKTEHVRLTLCRKIKHARTPEEISTILREYRAEGIA